MNGLIARAGTALMALACTTFFGWTNPASGQTHGAPYFSAAADPARQGFVRVVNRDDEAGTVSIEAIDDTGERFGPVTLSIGAGETVHFNSDDLEEGNAGKGLSGGVGEGSGDWRLELDSALDLEVLAYLRTTDGFLTAMHDAAPLDRSGHRVATFNPASNANQVSELRLINPGEEEASVRIVGIDDAGAVSEAETTVPAGASVTHTAQELEALGLGDGKGKWQLRVESDRAVRVLSLLRSPTGHLTNLSTAPASLAIDGEGAAVHRVALMPAAGGFVQGFVRVINHDDEPGTVAIDVIDDTGERRGSLELALEARETAHFNADDLRSGNPAKGLSGSVAEGVGAWRLEMRSSLAIEVLAYARTRDGFLTSLHDVSPIAGHDHHVGVFNPGSNRNQVSSLRLVNPGDEAAEVTIVGVDDEGETPGGEVSAVVSAGTAVTYTITELEAGSGEGLVGSIGEGAGKWRLRVTARKPIRVMSLMRSPTGHVTNLSTSPSPPPVRMVPVVADVDLPPEVDTVSPSDVTVTTLGREAVEVATGDAASLLIASDADGTLMLASADEDGGYADEGSGAVEVGIESTAIALVAVASGQRLAEIGRELADVIRAHDDFGRLVRVLTGLMAADKNYLDRLYDYPEAVTLIKSVAAGVAALRADASAAAWGPAGLPSKRAAVAGEETGPITAGYKDGFYCIGGGVAGSLLTPCSPWHEHEPWHWYGDAEGVKAFFPDGYLDVVLSLVIPGYSLGKGYVELGLQAATDPPFVAVSDNAVSGCRSWRCKSDMHAMANPNYVNYAMELYEDGKYRDWYYTPRNSSVIDKLLNSGAAYRLLRSGPGRSSRIHLGPEIDSIRFQRYRLSFSDDGEDDRDAAVSFMNTLHLVLVGVNLVSDVTALRDAVHGVQQIPALAKCVADVATRIAENEPDLLVNGQLVLDAAEPGHEPKDLLYHVFVDVAPGLLLGLGSGECGKFLGRLAGKGSGKLAEQVARAYADTAALATPLGWAKLVFDAANEAVPATVSYFAPGAASVDYHLSWDTNPNGAPYISAVSKSRPPQARFEYVRKGGFRLELDASTTTPGDSDELTFEWSVNGAVIGRGERFTHDFGAAGRYDMELMVTDGNGLTGTFSSGVEVTPGSRPVVSSLECTATGDRRFRMVAAFTDADGDIETVEWRSNASSEYADETTTADTAEVELTASRAAAWASVTVVDAEDNRATEVCTVDLEQGPAKRIGIDSASAACGREEPWRACYHRRSVGPNELAEFALTMPREPVGSWHGVWCVKEEKADLCMGQHDRLTRIDKRFANDAPLTFLTRPPVGAETFWVVAEVRECDAAPCTWPDDFTEVEFHHIEVTVGDDVVTGPGVLFSEDFESYEVGSLPEDYIIVFNGLSAAEQRVETEDGNRHLRARGLYLGSLREHFSSVHMRKDFDFDLPPIVSVQWRMRVDDDDVREWWTLPDGTRFAQLGSFSIKNADELSAGVAIDKHESDGRIVARCLGGDGSQPEVQLGVWTRFRVDVDFGAGRQSMYANGRKFCDTATLPVNLSSRWNSWGESSGMRFLSGNHGVAVTRFDDIEVAVRDDRQGKVYWTTLEGKIQRADLDGSYIEDVVTGLGFPETVGVDVRDGMLYWTDNFSRGFSSIANIQRSDLDGSNVETLVQVRGHSDGLALDIVSGKLYWSHENNGTIHRANLDGTNQEDLIAAGLVELRGIALDVEGGKIYWSQRFPAKIRRANLDGSDVENVATGTFAGGSIDLDLASRKIYWPASDEKKILRADLDGTNWESPRVWPWIPLAAKCTGRTAAPRTGLGGLISTAPTSRTSLL